MTLYSTYIHIKGYDKNGRRIFLVRGGKINPEKQNMHDQFRIHFLVTEIILDMLEQSSVTGFSLLQDATGMDINHASLYQPALMKKVMTILQTAYPMRPKALHLLNMPTVMEKVIAAMKAFMVEKMKDRIHLHNSDNMATIHEAFGKDVLPEEYGGTNGKVQEHIDNTVAMLESRKAWLKEQSNFKSDESKRPGQPKTFNDIFGMEGSFRKLAVD